jgi:hypothetical protein
MATTFVGAVLLFLTLAMAPVIARVALFKLPLDHSHAALISFAVGVSSLALPWLATGSFSGAGGVTPALGLGLFCFVILTAPYLTRRERERLAREKLKRDQHSSGLRGP